MPNPAQLLKRLDEIGQSLKNTDKALALLGLGSVGLERERLDNYADLDFFVIAKDGFKQYLIQDLSWLSNIAPIGFSFMNTADGHKALFKDGIYCEFAVFESHELAQIPFAEGKIIWQVPSFDATLCIPKQCAESWKPDSIEWAVGEILTCLYVGLQRLARGEQLVAMRFIQSYAFDLLMRLADKMTTASTVLPDVFQYERRFEARFPALKSEIADCLQGYNQSAASALAILELCKKHFDVNSFIEMEIRKLATQA